jgi:hypothetical protein
MAGNFKKLIALAQSYLSGAGGHAVISYTVLTMLPVDIIIVLF